jgi:DNA (cytosine-5)-methyltransferase 1
MRPRLLDLFCGAGGATAGYYRAGFDVTGVDLAPQPNYPFRFIRADAMTFPLGGFDAIHASPPCQRKSRMTNCRPGVAATYPDLIGPVRDRLRAWGGLYVIENVEGSGLPGQDDLLGAHGLMLCGLMFGLELYRHRWFETSSPVPVPGHPRHLIPASRAGHWKPGTIMSVEGHCAPIAVARAAMGGVDWMTRDELAESIPPAYTEHLGRQMLAAITRAREVA